MRELAPQFQIPWSIPLEAEDIPIVPTTSGTMYVLTSKDKHRFKLTVIITLPESLVSKLVQSF